jgi:diacylglycerol O-acyltransferase / wax synthase
MRPLSAQDNLFLTLDKGSHHMHVGGLGLYDPIGAPGKRVRFKTVLQHFSSLLGVSRALRSRLVAPPLDLFGLNRPGWLDEGDIDIEYHVRHIALPKPGDWQQLMNQVARIHSRPLDMSKPLWEAYVIEGLANIPGISPGSFAVYIKFHYAALDGVSSSDVLNLLNSPKPDPNNSDALPPLVADREPAAVEFYARSLGQRLHETTKAWQVASELGLRLADVGGSALRSGALLSEGRSWLTQRAARSARQAAPTLNALAPPSEQRSRFTGRISAHRVVDGVGLSLADCRKIQQHISGVTHTDIFLAAVSGALRQYLQTRNELPSNSLTAMVPDSARRADPQSPADSTLADHRLSLIATSLHSDLADPIERLRAISRDKLRAQTPTEKLLSDLPSQLVDLLPTALSAQLLESRFATQADVAITTLKGPQIPLYLAGAQLQLILPIATPRNGMGLNITGLLYNGMLWVSLVSCREMLPEPKEFADNLTAAFETLVTAAIATFATGPRTTSQTASAPSRARAKRASKGNEIPSSNAINPSPKAPRKTPRSRT